MREPGQEDGSQKLKRSRGGDATVTWKQSCRRSKGLEIGDEMSERLGHQDVAKKREGSIESDLMERIVEKIGRHK